MNEYQDKYFKTAVKNVNTITEKQRQLTLF